MLPSKRGRKQMAPVGEIIALGSRDDMSKKREHPPEEKTSQYAPSDSKSRKYSTATSPTIEDPAVLLTDLISIIEDGASNQQACSRLVATFQYLNNKKSQPDAGVYSSVLLLAQQKPNLFKEPAVRRTMYELLKRDVFSNTGLALGKVRQNCPSVILVCNIFAHVFAADSSWPTQFVKLYIEDSLNDRMWVDSLQNRDFILNVVTAFDTKVSQSFADTLTTFHPQTLMSSNTMSLLKEETASPSQSPKRIEEGVMLSELAIDGTKIVPRYEGSKQKIAGHLVTALNEVLSRRQLLDSAIRNIARLMTISCGVPEVRVIASQRLEIWLQNTKLQKPCQDLLTSLCLNCSGDVSSDSEVIVNLLKIRPKSKVFTTSMVRSLHDMASDHPSMIQPIIRHIVFNEFTHTHARNPNNLTFLAALFQADLGAASQHLSAVFRELFLNKDDYIKATRAFFREVIKYQRHDFDLVRYCEGLCDVVEPEIDSSLKERYQRNIIELITYAMFLSVSPSAKESFLANPRNDQPPAILHNVYSTIASILTCAVNWLKEQSSISSSHFKTYLQRLLYCDGIETYFRSDIWPPDNEKTVYVKIVREAPLSEEVLGNLIMFGIEPKFGLNPFDSFTFIEMILTRSLCKIPISNFTMIIDGMFMLASYRKPAEITLPDSFKQPNLAVTSLMWKTWLILFVLSVHNPKTIGKFCWNNYPQMRSFIEMSLTNTFAYPPATYLDETNTIESMKLAELQVIENERVQILALECHLAGKSMTAETSHLLSQVMIIDPDGSPRTPPSEFLSHLKNISYQLDCRRFFCQSRDPDFLLDVLQHNNSGQSSNWLSGIIMSSDISVDSLPVECLCEFLLNAPSTFSDNQVEILNKLQQRLATYLTPSEEVGVASTWSMINYFLLRLSNPSSEIRKRTTDVLLKLFSFVEGVDFHENSSFLDILSQCNWFHEFLVPIINLILKALDVETIIDVCSSYFSFLLKYILLLFKEPVFESSVSTLCRCLISRKHCFKKCFSQFTEKFADLLSSLIESNSTQAVNLNKNDSSRVVVQLGELFFHADDSIVYSIYLILSYPSSGEIWGNLFNQWIVEKPLFVDGSIVFTAIPFWIQEKLVLNNEDAASIFLEHFSLKQLLKIYTLFGVSDEIKSSISQILTECRLDEVRLCLKEEFTPSFLSLLRIHAKDNPTLLEAIQEPNANDPVSPTVSFEYNPKIKVTPEKVATDFLPDDAVRSDFVHNLTMLFNEETDDFIVPLIHSLVVKGNEDLVCTALLKVYNNSSCFTDWTKKFPSSAAMLVMFLARKVSSHRQLLIAVGRSKHLKHLLKNDIRRSEQLMQPKSPELIVSKPLQVSCSELLKNSEVKIGARSGQMISSSGPCLDLVCQIDPEISSRDYFAKILFSSNHESSSYHCFLVGHLLHQTCWRTLQTALQWILQNTEDVNPSVTLDVLAALQAHPRLITGNAHSRLPLKLSPSQAFALLDVILSEASSMKDDWITTLYSRIKLLHLMLDDFTSIQYASLIERLKPTLSLSKTVHLMMYLVSPLKIRPPPLNTYDESVGKFSFEFDTFFHKIILALSNSVGKKERFESATVILRNIASYHPIFLLRHVDMLSVILQGRMRDNWTTFSKEGHCDIFKVVIKLFRNITPDVFSYSAYATIFNTYMDAIVEFIDLNEESIKNFRLQLFNIIEIHLRSDQKELVRLLRPYAKKVYNCPELNEHLQNLLLIDSEVICCDKDKPSKSLQRKSLHSTVKFSDTWTEAKQLRMLMNSRENVRDEVIQKMHSISSMGRKNPLLFPEIMNDVRLLMERQDLSVNEHLANLVKKILKYCPQHSSAATSAYLKDLLTCSNSRQISKSLTMDLICLTQQYGFDLLMCIFEMAICGNVVCSDVITEVVRFQNLEQLFR